MVTRILLALAGLVFLGPPAWYIGRNVNAAYHNLPLPPQASTEAQWILLGFLAIGLMCLVMAIIHQPRDADGWMR